MYALALLGGVAMPAVTARMEAKEAADVAAQAANALLRSLKIGNQSHAALPLARGLSAVAVRLQAGDGATVSAQAAALIAEVKRGRPFADVRFWSAEDQQRPFHGERRGCHSSERIIALHSRIGFRIRVERHRAEFPCPRPC